MTKAQEHCCCLRKVPRLPPFFYGISVESFIANQTDLKMFIFMDIWNMEAFFYGIFVEVFVANQTDLNMVMDIWNMEAYL